MEEKPRISGIDVIGAAPWGTHLCQFYQTKQDLIDILVPYFKAGLENNESCIWVTAERLSTEEATEAMRKAVPDFDQYLERGQIELIPHTEWYLKDGVFNRQRVLNAWIDKLNQALAKGYDGIRVTGNTAWLEEEDWTSFTAYEEQVNNVIGKYHMLVIHTYPLDKCGVSETIDVIGRHHVALVKQADHWVKVGNPEHKRVEHDLHERVKELQCLYGITSIAERPSTTLDEVYQEVVNLLPSSWQYPEITCARITCGNKEFKTDNFKTTEWKQSANINVKERKEGTVEVYYLEARPEIDEGPFQKEERLLINAVAERLGEITERKQAEAMPQGNPKKTQQAKPEGHLTPLQKRVLSIGFKGLNDQEIIELLLSLVLPHRESERLAKECIKHFKNLRGLLTAPPQELQQAGITPPCMFCIKLLHELPEEILKQKIMELPAYESSKEVFDYLYYSMRDLKKEVFKVIYLNNRHQIIDTVDLFEGTLESIHIHPREIVESALKHHAAALIFAHNHPSGDPTASKSDKQLTRDLVFIGMILQIKVLDHIVIGENRYFSFADEGLIEKYEDNFLNLKIRGAFTNSAMNDLTDLHQVHTLHRN